MKSLVGTIGRSRFLHFAPKRIWVFPVQSCMVSVPVCSPWITSLVNGVTQAIANYKLIMTDASVNIDETPEANLDMVFAAIQKAPRSAEKICTTYLSKLCNHGNLLAAVRLLQYLQRRDIFLGPNAYNLVMEAAGEANEFEIVFHVFKDLMISQESLPLSSCLSFSKSLLNANDDVLILRLVEEVSYLDFPRSILAINKIICAFGESRQFNKALLMFDKIKDTNCRPDLVTYNTVLDILGCAGRVEEMLQEFSSMKEAGIVPDFVSYNTLLHHLQKAGRLDLCLVYITEMGESGILPDLLTYTSLIYSFGKSGNLDASLRLFDDMKTRKIRLSIYIYRSLINTANKLGKEELAMTLLEEMNSSLPNLAGPNDFKPKSKRR